MQNKELIVDLVSWIARQARPYDDVMEAWRTSCPRLTIWEDATDEGLIERALDEDKLPIVRVTDKGQAFLRSLDS